MINVPEHRIVVGSWDDYLTAITGTRAAHDVIVTVCDMAPDFGKTRADLYWYPLNERSRWGYGVFFWAKRILDFHTRQGDSILIHCEAGVHRSPMILFTWLLSLQVESGCIDLNRISQTMGDDYADTYQWDVGRGTIPPDLDRLYAVMADRTMSLAECLGRIQRHTEH